MTVEPEGGESVTTHDDMDYTAQETRWGVTVSHIQRSAHDTDYGVARFSDSVGRSYWTPIRFTEDGIEKVGGPTGYEVVEDAWYALNTKHLDIDLEEAIDPA